jgi:hypothetical protein
MTCSEEVDLFLVFCLTRHLGRAFKIFFFHHRLQESESVRWMPQLFSMITRVFSAAVVGVDATEIEIEVNTGSGEPSIVVDGIINTNPPYL